MAITKKDQKITTCELLSCKECLFHETCARGNREKAILDWLNQEYETLERWKNLPLDTPILELDYQNIHHFYKFENGYVYYFTNGCTSYTSGYRKALKENKLDTFKSFAKIPASFCEIIPKE